jgi:DNA-binding transcriptional MerR regulator
MAVIHEGMTVSQVIGVAHASQRELQYWRETGLIVPSVHYSTQRGRANLYGFPDIVALRTVKELRSAGISLQGVRKVAAFLKARDPLASFANTWLLTDGADVYERQGDVTISAMRQPGQHVMTWVIDLGMIAQAVQAEMEQIAA